MPEKEVLKFFHLNKIEHKFPDLTVHAVAG
jgi:hypothetical protein